jgi:hypothetical protein
MDSKKIKGYWSSVPRVFKSPFEVRIITSTSIVLAEFGEFPFEHFAWGQALLYYNRVSMVTKDCILEKALGSPTRYAWCGKDMLGWIREKMTILESTPKGGRFYASSLTTTRNDALACNDPCAPGRDCSTAAENNSWDNAHTSNLSNKVRG